MNMLPAPFAWYALCTQEGRRGKGGAKSISKRYKDGLVSLCFFEEDVYETKFTSVRHFWASDYLHHFALRELLYCFHKPYSKMAANKLFFCLHVN
mgnify:CR=1